jgi:hypothetical protein
MRPATLVFTHAVLLASFSTPLVALTPEQARVLEEISRDPQAKQEALAKLKSRGASSRTATMSSMSVAKTSGNAPTGVSASPSSASDTKPTDTINALLSQNQGKSWDAQQYSPCAGFSVLLRQDWSDFKNMAGFECPGDPGAQGAQISYSTDRIADNRQVTIHGTAAVLYNSATGSPPSDFIPYATSFGATCPRMT